MIHAPATIRAITVPGLHKPLSLEMVVLGVAVVLLVILVVSKTIQGRNVKKRKAAADRPYDADVALDGAGPVGFSGETSAGSAGPPPLVPPFAALASGGGSTTQPSVANAMPPASSVHGRELVGSPRSGGPESPPPSIAPPSVAPPAGWLPDPSGDPEVIRYWDGAAWTIHTAQRIR